jgi:uncharacterized protein YgiM (DUF1202 family)
MWHKLSLLLIVLVALGSFAAQPALAQSATWHVDFYNNEYLLGTPAASRTDNALAWDWGNAAPAPGVNPDGFSARWAADPYFPAGTYRFWVLADDNVKLNVGYAFSPQIDTFSNPAVGQIVSADITLTEGVHHVQVDYREVIGSAYIYVTWANLATNPSGPNFPIPQISFSNLNNGPWTAQYYGNPNLAGSPTLIQTENDPSHDWGAGSPAASIPADNFSARWTSVQTLDAGSYTVTVRADDGVRVTVDGITYINEWHPANNATYTATFNLAAGQHNFQIEYFEAGGFAFMLYNLSKAGVSAPPPGSNPADTGTTATVTAGRLNVRSEPSTSATILTKINRNETYPVVGSNTDRTWYQINVNGTVGWVASNFVRLNNAANVPVSNSGTQFAQPSTTGYIVTALATVNIRNAPNTRGTTVLGKLPVNVTASVVGRNADNTWWQVDYQGIVGWVSARYAQLQSGVDTNTIPVTG